MAKQQCGLSMMQKSLFQQGYQTYTPAELKQLEWGLRFTPAACSSITLYALITQQPLLLFVVSVLGMWAFFFPAGHPMDLIYNNVVRKLFDGTRLPPNPFQRRLACFAAGIMNAMAGAFFLMGMPMAALITGGMLLVLQAIVIFTHFCTLSWMYEGVMRMFGRWAVPTDDAATMELLENGALLVDVRGPDEFARGHVYGAKNFPLDDIEGYVTELAKQPVLLYCASGTRSQIAKQKLSAQGVNDIYDIGSISRVKALVEQN